MPIGNNNIEYCSRKRGAKQTCRDINPKQHSQNKIENDKVKNELKRIYNRLRKKSIDHIRLDKLRPKHIISLYQSLSEEGVAQRAISLSKNKHIDLKQMVRSNGFTMESFAKSSNISIRTLCEACNNRPVSIQSAEKICHALDKTLTEIFIVPNVKQKLDSSTIRKHHAVLSSILSTAVKWQLIPYNPCERVQPPKLSHKDVLYLKVPDHVIQLLKKYRLQQKEQRLKLGDRWQNSGRILVQWNGAPIHPSTVTNWFHTSILNSDLPDIHLHSIRHTNITLQIAGGIPLTTVAARAGHANSSTTSKIYAHAIQSSDEAASQYLDNILRPKTPTHGKKNMS